MLSNGREPLRQKEASMRSNSRPVWMSMFCLILVCASAAGTFMYNRSWRDTRTLCTDILNKQSSSLRLREQAFCAVAMDIFRHSGVRKALEFMNGPDAETYSGGERFNYMKAKLHFINKDTEQALSHLDKIVNNRRLLARARYIRGMIALNNGQEKDALSHFRKSVGYDPHYWYSRYRMARIYRRKGDIGTAVLVLSEVVDSMYDNIAVNREFASLLYMLAEERKREGSASMAVELLLNSEKILKRVIDRGYADRPLRLFYVDILIASEYLDRAKVYMDELYRTCPDDPAVVERYVRYCRNFVQYRKAEDLCEKLNRLTGGNNLTVLFLLGEIYYRRRMFDKAERVLNRCRVISAEAGSAEQELKALNNLAKIDMYVGDYENARKKYTSVISSDRSFWQAYAGLAEIRIRNRDFAAAEKALQILRGLVPRTYFTLVKLESMLEREQKREQYRQRYRDQKSHG